MQTLTTMLMSYRRPSYLAQIERLSASKHAIKLLENAVPMEEPYFQTISDRYFEKLYVSCQSLHMVGFM
ncbi:acetyltransferase [Lacticaseibacillus rhamnosus MTCC 5462]|nr:acetyltransferase [Lacticaseibacillus rhamnosus MTCC 5462]